MKLLFVNGCISQRGEESRTLVLARSFLDAWQARHPEAEVETVEPEALLALKPFAPEMLNDRDALAGIRCFDAPVYDLARQFRAADRVVVAAPFWDLTFPAALRTYIEYISANGLTYHYEADGCHGDCRAEKLAYLTSGGDLEQPESLGVLYWKQLCAMFGIERFGLETGRAVQHVVIVECCHGCGVFGFRGADCHAAECCPGRDQSKNPSSSSVYCDCCISSSQSYSVTRSGRRNRSCLEMPSAGFL